MAAAACDGATTPTTSAPISANVSGSTDVDVYVFALAGMSNDVTIKVSDATNELRLQDFGNCDLTRGPGIGGPIDGTWDGTDQLAHFTAGSGTYYATVRTKSGFHSYPL